MALPSSILNLVNEFNRLPGVGPKTAERYAFYLVKQSKTTTDKFIQALTNLKNNIKLCSECFDFSEQNPCTICADAQRDKKIICVVAENADLLALEKTNQFKGVYHVLGGYINRIDNIGPEQLKIKELIARIKKNNAQELILGLDANIEGETTALYINKELKPLNIKITRLARGLPMGSDIEYADEITLSSALSGRREI